MDPAKPYYLRDVHTIAIPTFVNKTLLPRVEVLVTDTVIKQFQQDGTFRIGSGGLSEASLKREVILVCITPGRSVTGDVLGTCVVYMSIQVRYRLGGPGGKTPRAFSAVV